MLSGQKITRISLSFGNKIIEIIMGLCGRRVILLCDQNTIDRPDKKAVVCSEEAEKTEQEAIHIYVHNCFRVLTEQLALWREKRLKARQKEHLKANS